MSEKIIIETSTQNNQFELEKQLHEQYAINNNANVGSFIAFVVAVFALFGFYGYVFVHSSCDFTTQGEYIVDGLYTLDVLLILTVVVSGMLCFLCKIVLDLGYGHRRDQFIVEAIRRKYYTESEYGKIFPEKYNPLGKKRNDFIPNFYHSFYWLFVIALFVIIMLTIIKLRQNICFNKDENLGFSHVCGLIASIISCICFMTSLCMRCCRWRSYKEKEQEFLSKREPLKTQNSALHSFSKMLIYFK